MMLHTGIHQQDVDELHALIAEVSAETKRLQASKVEARLAAGTLAAAPRQSSAKRHRSSQVSTDFALMSLP